MRQVICSGSRHQLRKSRLQRRPSKPEDCHLASWSNLELLHFQIDSHRLLTRSKIKVIFELRVVKTNFRIVIVNKINQDRIKVSNCQVALIYENRSGLSKRESLGTILADSSCQLLSGQALIVKVKVYRGRPAKKVCSKELSRCWKN